MKISASGRLLLLLARFLDYHERIHSITLTMRYLAGDPRLGRHRRWAMEYLRQRQQLNHMMLGLKRRGYLQEKVFGKTRGYILTPKGEMKLLQLKLRDTAERKRLSGDQWLMVFFDIPETHRRERESLRMNLRLLGFELVQKSVWVTRFDVRSELRQWVAMRHLTQYVRLLLVKELDHEGRYFQAIA